MIRLLIKGTREDALREILARGITGHAREPVTESAREVQIRVADRHYGAVAAWFCEAPHVAPYPVGTLLHYSAEEPSAQMRPETMPRGD